MNMEPAATKESAPLTEAALEENAAVEAESAPASEAEAGTPSETPQETPGSGPRKELGDKGKAEVVKLRKRAQKAEQESAYYRGLAEGRAVKGEEGARPQADESIMNPNDPEPQAEQFQSTGEYTKELAKWQVRQERFSAKVRDHHERVQEQFQNTISKGQEKYKEDFGEKLADLKDAVGVIKPHLIEAISGSENEADVLYYLGSNPDEASRINSLSPIQAIKEIARIEAKVAGGQQPPPKKITTAPEPVRTLTGGRIPVEQTALSAKDDAEYYARREAQRKNGKR